MNTNNNIAAITLLGLDLQSSAAALADTLEQSTITIISSNDLSIILADYSGSIALFKRYPNLRVLVIMKMGMWILATPKKTIEVTYTDKQLDIYSILVNYLQSQPLDSEFSLDSFIHVLPAPCKWKECDNEVFWRLNSQNIKSKSSYRTLIREAIVNGDIPPFVYTYPPRSAYRKPGKNMSVKEVWQLDKSYSQTQDLNLYIHYPFCRYKCGFCNLYSIASTEVDLITRYTQAVVKQLYLNQELIKNRRLVTIYIGGGTPTLMSKANFTLLTDTISDIVPNWRQTVVEFCIEASPDSIVNPSEEGALDLFLEKGLTRANLGLQTVKNTELRGMGRPVSAELGWQAIEILKAKGLSNLSTDLIMGFSDQTEASWMESVSELVKRSPETISTYFLTIRPDNRFGRTGRYTYYRDPKLYRWYELARQKILSHGYIQESNVRYIIPGKGGYEQKVRHFSGTPLLGIGVGARSYTQTLDYIIGGDSQPNREQIIKYIEAMATGNQTITAGFVYDDIDRISKRFALDLFKLDLADMEPYHIKKHAHIFMPILAALVEEGLVHQSKPNRYELTHSGYKYRDIVSWLFFSNKVIDLDNQFYQQLHESNLKLT
jgi:oxygen-independent coproporphyrinogen III oxidase